MEGGRLTKHRRLVRLGSHEAQSDDLQPGFRDAEELFHLPDRVVKGLQEKAPNKLRNIASLAQRGGIDLFSFMAGKGDVRQRPHAHQPSPQEARCGAGGNNRWLRLRLSY